MRFYPEGRIMDSMENKAALRSPATLMEAIKDRRVLEARAAMCDSSHNIVIDLGFMKGIIPREEGAIGIREGTVRDIAIISRVNHPVCFLAEELVRDNSGELSVLLSRRAAQELCNKEYISKLKPGDVIDAKVTHIEPFGVFADIGCGLPALLPIDSISVSRISSPSERFHTGMKIKAIVKSNEASGDSCRVTLSHKELLGTWLENAKNFSPGETVPGTVRSVEPYGIFVELAPNLAGLAEIKDGVQAGHEASVFIKSILPSRMKIKLIIIDTFSQEINRLEAPKYYFSGEHMDRFIYSPEGSEKQVVTEFVSGAD